jgi:dCTP deaminase
MWNDRQIWMAMRTGDLDPIAYVPDMRRKRYGGDIDPSQVQPASLDVRLSHDLILHPSGTLIRLDGVGHQLAPGECILGSTVERFMIPDNVVARVEGKSSWAREFLTVHSAGFVDPGFKGDITLELKNDGHKWLTLRAGMMIAQVSFQSLSAPAMRPYGSEGIGSHYQGQWGATASRGM